MKTEKYLKDVLEYLTIPNQKSLEMSMNNVHARGIFSLVINNTEPGWLTRVFIAHKKLNPFDVQYHTHRYPITITVLKGDITHHIAKKTEDNDDEAGALKISEFTYKSFLNGGDGLSYLKDTMVRCHDYKMPIGSSIYLTPDDFHTMSCSKGSIWIVEEEGFEAEESRVLGFPFVVDHLYDKPEMFQINDNCQLVIREVKRILMEYKLSGVNEQ